MEKTYTEIRQDIVNKACNERDVYLQILNYFNVDASLTTLPKEVKNVKTNIKADYTKVNKHNFFFMKPKAKKEAVDGTSLEDDMWYLQDVLNAYHTIDKKIKTRDLEGYDIIGEMFPIKKNIPGLFTREFEKEHIGSFDEAWEYTAEFVGRCMKSRIDPYLERHAFYQTQENAACYKSGEFLEGMVRIPYTVYSDMYTSANGHVSYFAKDDEWPYRVEIISPTTGKEESWGFGEPKASDVHISKFLDSQLLSYEEKHRSWLYFPLAFFCDNRIPETVEVLQKTPISKYAILMENIYKRMEHGMVYVDKESWERKLMMDDNTMFVRKLIIIPNTSPAYRECSKESYRVYTNTCIYNTGCKLYNGQELWTARKNQFDMSPISFEMQEIKERIETMLELDPLHDKDWKDVLKQLENEIEYQKNIKQPVSKYEYQQFQLHNEGLKHILSQWGETYVKNHCVEKENQETVSIVIAPSEEHLTHSVFDRTFNYEHM